jgi:hypothetical protein
MTRQRKASAALDEQFARLGVAPERTATTEELATEREKTDRGRAMAARRDGRPMPAERRSAQRWGARISLTATAEQKRALDMARAMDGIPDTARIRAMITLWQDDERLRARVDKFARSDRV